MGLSREQDPKAVAFRVCARKVSFIRRPRCEHEPTQLECFAKRLPMYEVKFTVGGIGRLLPVATSLLGLGLFVIWTAAAHSQVTPQAEPQSDPPAAQVESGRKQFSQSCA